MDNVQIPAPWLADERAFTNKVIESERRAADALMAIFVTVAPGAGENWQPEKKALAEIALGGLFAPRYVEKILGNWK